MIDGDTVIFEDGEHVRMIGIDAPELGYEDDPDQPGAAAARQWLARRLVRGTPVLSGADHENRDRHGRLLRHLFLSDGTNLQAAMLREGLATRLTIPPSVGYLPCYHAAATTAEEAAIGLWGRPEYRSMEAVALPSGTHGYRIVTSIVLESHPARDGFRLRLEGALTAYIPGSSSNAFGQDLIRALAGRRVEVRGMVYPRHGALQMILRHPLDLRLAGDEGNPAAPRASN